MKIKVKTKNRMIGLCKSRMQDYVETEEIEDIKKYEDQDQDQEKTKIV